MKESRVLQTNFNRHGISYRLLKRKNNYALFEQSLDKRIVGYEVSRIFTREVFGKIYESICSDEAFGNVREKQFFPGDFEEAQKYFEFTSEGILI
jgi:hypothetical protein